jgi:hypothetical protein
VTGPANGVEERPAVSGVSGHGRWIGLALLAAIGLIVAAVPPVDGRRVAGSAQVAELPAAPQVGTCLRYPGAARPGGPATSTTRAQRTFGPCDEQPALGEVVAVDVLSAGQVGPPPPEVCSDEAAAYAGLQPTPDGYATVNPTAAPGGSASAADPVRWTNPFTSITEWVAQAPSLPDSASTWFACLVQPITGLQYRSLAGAFDGGTLPANYGTCWVASAPAPGDATVACGWPHLSELIGGGAVGDDATDDVVERSCHDQAARLLGRDDPTVGGILSVHVWQENPADGQSSREIAGYLRVTSGRLIEGSLIGLKSGTVTFVR